MEKSPSLSELSCTLIKVTELESHHLLLAETKNHPKRCRHCDSAEIVGFGRRNDTIVDLPFGSKHTHILLRRRRYRCQSCGKTFLDAVDFKDDKRQMTRRLIKYIERESQIRTFYAVADSVGVDEKTVRNIFYDYQEKSKKNSKFLTPEWIGIQDMTIIKPRCVITNVAQETIIDILDSPNKSVVKSFLSKQKNRESVRYVSMSLRQSYRDAVATMLPGATIVVDKANVLRLIDEAMQSAFKSLLTPKLLRAIERQRRTLIQGSNSMLLGEMALVDALIREHPMLAHIHEHLKNFNRIWESGTRRQAESAYYAWEAQTTPEIEAHVSNLKKVMAGWHDEVFAYFDHRNTSACTENLENLSKKIGGLSRGSSFDAMRARLLYTQDFWSLMPSIGPTKLKHEKHSEVIPCYGVSISALTGEIDAGRL